MNKIEQNILETSLEALKKNNNILGKWEDNSSESIDCRVSLTLNNQDLNFYAEVKNEIRNHQLNQFEKQNEKFKPYLVVANRFSSYQKEEFRKKNISYLEANGNIFIVEKNKYIWIDTQKPLQTSKENPNRAFTKTGLKVIFNLLNDYELVNQTYREIANKTNVALGVITNVYFGLKEKGFLIKLDKKKWKLVNTDELLKIWIGSYEEKLKPSLYIGTFRFFERIDTKNWKKLDLNSNQTFWGGESSATLMTKYLNPEILTIYTTEKKTDLIKKYKLIPDPNGNIKIYQKFWETNEFSEKIVPPILTYADLINTNDSRNIETANIIYNEYIKDKYR